MVRPVDGADELTPVPRRSAAECIRDRSGNRRRRGDLRLCAGSAWPASARSYSTPTPSPALPRAAATRIGAETGREAGRSTILTPHEGEFSRFFGALSEKAKSGRSSIARALPRASPRDRPAQRCRYSGCGPRWPGRHRGQRPAYLATAGAGDVLAGIALGYWRRACRPSKRPRRRHLASWRSGTELRVRAHCRGPAGVLAAGLPSSC